MSANPARHQVTNIPAPGFWAAAGLLDHTRTAGMARHARRSAPRHAAHIGRIGALAVSLGIGIAIANSSSGVAHADDGSDAGSGAGTSVASGSSEPGGESSSDAGERTQSPDDHEESELGDANDDDPDDLTEQSGETPSASNDDPDDLTEESEATPSADQDEHTGAVEAEPPLDDRIDPTGDESLEPREVAVRTSSTGATAADQAAIEVADGPGQKVGSVDLVGSVVSTVVAPLADPELPAPSPVADSLLAWVRRLITHTFFNKTPVVRSVTTEQILTGQVVIDIDAYDPNGDPLTYDIVQPESGLVFREPLTGKFVYTPSLPVIGDPVTVQFDVIVRDDSEHLTGVLGGIQSILHSIARLFGLAKVDNYTQTVEFDIDPILQSPPALAVTGGLPYLLGGDPVGLLSLAKIVDADSPSMNQATVTIGVGRQAGDKLRYAAPAGVSIDAEQVNEYTVKLTGLASQADYETALKAVTFSTTDLGLVARTVDVTITDQHGLSNIVPAFAVVTVLPGLPLDAPPSVLAVGGTPYFLGEDPVALLSVAQIVDPDSSAMTRALVRIGELGRMAGDTLTYVAPAGITIGVQQIDDWTLELTGMHSNADYETALKAITFSATQLGLVARTVEITLTDADGIDSLLPALVAATVLPAIDLEPPLIVTPVGVPIHTIGKAPVTVMSAVGIANADDGLLNGAVVAIGLNRMTGDKLGFSVIQDSPVTVAQTNDWTVTLSGTATVEQYQEALKAITFSATQLGLPRTITVNVTEVDGDTSPAPGIVFASSVAPLRPTVIVASLPPTYTIGRAGSVLMPVVTVEDLDSAVLTGATVTLGVTRQAGDILAYSTPPGGTITGSWNGADTLTLSGSATVAEYEAALEAVTFSATAGAGILRTMTVDVVDDSGLTALLPGAATALVKNPDRPTVVTVGLSGLPFPSVGQTVNPITLATIVDTDSAVLTGASVKITDKFTSGDALGYAPIAGNPITANYNTATGELTLTGTATIAQYTQALQAITFRATNYGGGLFDVLGVTRTLSVYVTDDSNVTNLIPGVVAVTVFR
ncbi:hypothetical protein [Mycolicibacterium sp. D5.8-2]|uniref:hypothetical protein n=1 Tax=Mycolicibacterium sp. D5.8-2 TaxID=3085903 RepID=UPI00298C2A48|nr:hypothetical protein [Mycolicibacterium sp. D5.8-2]MDW5612666.1 hypothetical protein [Mycolicibacterium sp. D5.8-2]